jgi:hypothetical protein
MTASEFERGFSAGVAWLASEADRAARAIVAGGPLAPMDDDIPF